MMNTRILMSCFALLLVMSCASMHQINSNDDNRLGKIYHYTCDEFTYYQAKTVRVYFSYYFQVGYIGLHDDVDSTVTDSLQIYKKYYQYTLESLGSLFDRGIITGEMFVDSAIGNDRRTGVARYLLKTPECSRKFPFDSTNLLNELNANNCKLIKILSFFASTENELDPTIHNYEINVVFEPYGDGWSGSERYSLRIKSDVQDKLNNKEYFGKAILLSLKYEGSEM